MKRYPVRLTLMLLTLLSSVALAKVDFELTTFSASSFSDFQKLEAACSAPAATSFWCSRLDAELSLIVTKSTDYFFDDNGSLVALFIKQTKGQNFKGNYKVDSNQNLIPVTSSAPGGAVFLDGETLEPETLQGAWERVSNEGAPAFQGRFQYSLGDVQIDKTLLVKNAGHIIDVELRAARRAAEGADESGEDTVVQYVVPGIARAETPTFKLGRGDSFTVNPASQAENNPRYVSVQTHKRDTGNAIVLRPQGDETGVAAQVLPPNLIALQTTLPSGPGEVTLALEAYLGQNELVRYSQEGYLDLPGLFNPNILGRISLGILWILKRINELVGSWGITIILFSVLFRMMIWPLITAQTKSMYGMQDLQPKLQALQKKHKDDREKLTQETMKLYKEAGVNPAGGCLPMLLQMPIFIILWRIFANFEFGSGFLWLPDLGQADPYYILPLLYVGVMIAQSFFMARGNPQSLRQQLLMNVVFVFLFINFPAGVILYYVVIMLIQVFQYWLIRRERPAVPAKAT